MSRNAVAMAPEKRSMGFGYMGFSGTGKYQHTAIDKLKAAEGDE